MAESKIEKSWSNLLDSYEIPTFAKKLILEPLIINQTYLEPILDAGCGTGYFSNLLFQKGFQVISIDKNLDLKKIKSHNKFKVNIEDFNFNNKIGDILLINVLSCVEPERRIKILKNLKKIKSSASRIFVVNTSEELGSNNFQSKFIQSKKISSNVVFLENKKIDNSHIDFEDYLIGDEEFRKVCKHIGLKIIKYEKLHFPKEKSTIFDFYILK
ncbi:MAG: methyltransferase domain-containing protein [Nanoarchaeota archaeon]|nr:methyltransferase domain-containing protein [Nanoarchaeota archaeon]